MCLEESPDLIGVAMGELSHPNLRAKKPVIDLVSFRKTRPTSRAFLARYILFPECDRKGKALKVHFSALIPRRRRQVFCPRPALEK